MLIFRDWDCNFFSLKQYRNIDLEVVALCILFFFVCSTSFLHFYLPVLNQLYLSISFVIDMYLSFLYILTCYLVKPSCYFEKGSFFCFSAFVTGKYIYVNILYTTDSDNINQCCFLLSLNNFSSIQFIVFVKLQFSIINE